MALRAQAEADVALIYWFADKTFLGAASAREAFHWQPTPGTYRLLALDDHGRTGTGTVTIQTTDEQPALTASAH